MILLIFTFQSIWKWFLVKCHSTNSNIVDQRPISNLCDVFYFRLITQAHANALKFVKDTHTLIHTLACICIESLANCYANNKHANGPTKKTRWKLEIRVNYGVSLKFHTSENIWCDTLHHVVQSHFPHSINIMFH